MKCWAWNPVGIVCVCVCVGDRGGSNVHIAAFHQNEFIFFFVLSVVASLLLLGLSGATRKDTAGNLPRHHSCHIFYPSLNTPLVFFLPEALMPHSHSRVPFSEKQLRSETCRTVRNVGEGTGRRPLHFSQLPEQVPPRHWVCLHPWR